MPEMTKLQRAEWLYNSNAIDFDAFSRMVEDARVAALSSYDASDYYKASNLLNLSVDSLERPELYEQGEAEEIYAERGIPAAPQVQPAQPAQQNAQPARRARRPLTQNIRNFVEEADRGNLNVNDIGEHIDSKCGLLTGHFRRFQEGENQDLRRYSRVQVGTIFRELYNQYSARIEEERNQNFN